MIYEQSIEQIFKKFNTSDSGLDSDSADKLLKKHGENKLPTAGLGAGRGKIFFDQWKSPLILVLLAAGIISGLLREVADMVVIFLTVFVNVMIGFAQEYKANKALLDLKKISDAKALVIRGGKKFFLSSERLTLGDVVFLTAGDKIPADGRLIETKDFSADESVLTGESNPVKKHSRKISGEKILSDQANMVFSGTVASSGRAMFVVTAIGEDTEIGKIAGLVFRTVEEKTPLQAQLKKLALYITGLVGVFFVMIMVLGFARPPEALGFFPLLKTSVAVAVAAIPEGLTISLTVILALGMQQILKRKALVRKMIAAETLGSVNVICVDKTGTLTEGKMEMIKLITANGDWQKDEFPRVSLAENGEQEGILALKAAVLCNDATPSAKGERNVFFGDSTETALLAAGAAAGLEKEVMDKAFPRKSEITFDSRRKYMATFHEVDDDLVAYVKGAPEVILSLSEYFEERGTAKKMNKEKRSFFLQKAEEMAKKGYRVLALAHKREDKKNYFRREKDVKNLVFIGLAVFSDPLRPEARQTIDYAKKAGIKVVMITGDHKETAETLARTLGLQTRDDQALTGADLEKMSDAELEQVVSKITVFARVSPEHKIRVVRAFQAGGAVVAMTGDGVNDGPALKGADVGVALGSGTDVAKETSDLILLDDSFSTIVAAIEEGRRIYQNIKKIVLYLLSGSLAEVVLIAGSIIGGMPLALLPAQILWINMIVDSLPNVALAFDPGDKENMNEPPRPKKEAILDADTKKMILIFSLVSSFLLFVFYYFLWKKGLEIELARTLVFCALGISTLFYAYSARSLRRSVWRINPLENRVFLLTLIFGIVLVVAAVYWPPLQNLLHNTSVPALYWFFIILTGIAHVVLIEILKSAFLRQKNGKIA